WPAMPPRPDRPLAAGEWAALSGGLAGALRQAGAAPVLRDRDHPGATIAALWRGAAPILTRHDVIWWARAPDDLSAPGRERAMSGACAALGAAEFGADVAAPSPACARLRQRYGEGRLRREDLQLDPVSARARRPGGGGLSRSPVAGRRLRGLPRRLRRVLRHQR